MNTFDSVNKLNGFNFTNYVILILYNFLFVKLVAQNEYLKTKRNINGLGFLFLICSFVT